MTLHPDVPVLEHPGPRHPARITSVPTSSVVVRADLRPGARLVEALSEVLAPTGCTSASVELMGGTLAHIPHCIPAVCTDGSRAATFSATRHAPAPAQLVTGSVTLGYRDDERFAHCHAAWLDADGALAGGHLWPEAAVGDVPVHAVVHGLPALTMLSADDDETRLPVFTPVPSGTAAAPGGGRAIISRVRPGVDITAAVAGICRTHGFRSATVRASVGSLVGACMYRGDGTLDVDGPATEVISLQGVAGSGAGADRGGADLSAVVVDRYGEIHAGRLVPGRNPVAVTYELLIEEGGADATRNQP